MADLDTLELIKPELDKNGVLTINVIQYKPISAVTINTIIINNNSYDN